MSFKLYEHYSNLGLKEEIDIMNKLWHPVHHQNHCQIVLLSSYTHHHLQVGMTVCSRVCRGMMEAANNFVTVAGSTIVSIFTCLTPAVSVHP